MSDPVNEINYILPLQSGEVPQQPTAEHSRRPLSIEVCERCGSSEWHWGLCEETR